MAGWPPEKNATFTWFFFIRDADGDPVAGASTLDVEFSIDGGVFANVAGTEVDEGEGLYSCPITAAEMNGDVIALICKTGTAGAKTAAQAIYTSTRQIDDLAFPAISGRSVAVETDGMIHADLKEWLGVAPLALVAQRVNSSVGAMAAAVLTAAALATDAVNEIRDAILSQLSARRNTATAGAAGSITLDAGAPITVDLFKGQLIFLDSGTGVGQVRLITAYSAGRVATITPDWATNPVSGTTFVILAAGQSVGITGAINDFDGLNDLSASQVNAEMVDVVNVDAISELSQGVPTATPTINTALMLMYMALRNKLDVDASFKEVHNNAGTVIAKKALSDDATTYSEAEMETGP